MHTFLKKRTILQPHLTVLINNGVIIKFPDTIIIDATVIITATTTIGPHVHIVGNTSIAHDCTIGAFTLIENCIIENNVTLHAHTIVRNSIIKQGAIIGPFAHIHTNSTIGEHAIIGNFVEIKESIVGAHTKAKHLSYIGNALIGKHVNIGAGTITCNHSGTTKNKTIIEDNAYIGSNNSLVAPITIGYNAFTAAGSTITQDVPSNALGIGRARQVNKLGYALLLKQKKPQEMANL